MNLSITELIVRTLFIYLIFGWTLVSLGKKYAIESSTYNGISKGNDAKFWTKSMFLLVLVFVLLSGFRYDVGRDYLSHLRDYVNGYELFRDHEPIFHWITVLFYRLKVPVPLYFGFWAFIQISFFLAGLREEKYAYPFILFFLITNETYMSWMNGIRQDIAACIWLFSLPFLLEKKFFKYLFFLIFAMGFHKSALLLIVMYPLLSSDKDFIKSISLQITIFAVVNIIRIFFGDYFLKMDSLLSYFTSIFGSDSRYSTYTTELLKENVEDFVGGTGLGNIFKIVVYTIIMLYSNKLKLFYNSHRFNVLYTCFYIGICASFLFPDGMNFLMRPFRYFTPFSTIILGLFLYYLFNSQNKKSGQNVLGLFLILCYIGMYAMSIVLAPEGFSIFFQFTFEQPRSEFIFY